MLASNHQTIVIIVVFVGHACLSTIVLVGVWLETFEYLGEPC